MKQKHKVGFFKSITKTVQILKLPALSVAIFLCIPLFVADAANANQKSDDSKVLTTPTRVTGLGLGAAVEYKEDELLVRYADATSDGFGIATAHTSPHTSRFERVTVPVSTTAEEELARIAQDPRVLSVERNIIRRATVTPNDPYFSLQTHLSGSAGSVSADEAWETQTGSTAVVVAVVDTGLDTDHPDIADNLWVNSAEIPDNDIDDDENGYVDDINGYDFADNDGDPNPAANSVDDDGFAGADTGVTHGTHVAGIIAAVGNNEVGVSGVAWTASIMGIKTLDDEGAGTDADIATGIHYAVDNGAQIINMSLGGYGSTEVLQESVQYAIDNGVLVVTAAGNDGIDIEQDPFYPACYSDVIGVSSVAEDGTASSFSNYGAGCVDIAAPGENVFSTVYVDPENGFTDEYAYLSGTSMATPVVAGILTVLQAHDATLESADLMEILLASAIDTGLDPDYGVGKADAAAALASIRIVDNPSTPTGLTAYTDATAAKTIKENKRTSDTSPYFTWSASSDEDGIAGYYVYFGTDGNADPVTEGAVQTETNYTPTVVPSGDDKAYYLRVAAVDAVENLSNSVGEFVYLVDTQVTSPKKVSAKNAGKGVQVSWKKVKSQHVDKYRVYRQLVDLTTTARSSTAYKRVATVDQPMLEFSDTAVAPYTQYRYRVDSVDDLDNTTSSKQKKFTFVPQERIVAAAVTNRVASVVVYNTARNRVEKNWTAFSSTGATSVEVAVGNLDSDSKDEVVVALGAGAEPRVSVFERNGKQRVSFLAYDAAFRGGVRVAVGDVDGDGEKEIITVPGSGMVAQVKIFGMDGKQKIKSFTAFDGKWSGGLFVATTNWNGRGGDEVVVAADSGGSPQVIVYTAAGKQLSSFLAYDAAFRGGVRVAGAQSAKSDADFIITVPAEGVTDVHRYGLVSGKAKLLQPGFYGFVQTYTGGGALAGADLTQTQTDRVVVASQGGRQATIQVFALTGGSLLQTIFPFGGSTSPVSVAAGWLY